VTEAASETAVLKKVAWRLLPFMGLLYFAAYLDRVNVGFAALTMNADIGLSEAAYGLGSGIFFIGYFLFEIPSNLILEKVGARRWIARIMVTWGALSAAMALVQGPVSFYVVRFLLGAAEAGFFPGMILYLTYWFPWTQRARIVAAFMMAIPLSTALGAPVSTAILGTSLAGLAGWLTDEEKATLARAIARDEQAPPASGGHLHGLGPALANLQVWRFAAVYFCIIMGNYGLGFWMPQIVKGFGGLSNIQTGWLTAAPYLVAAIAMALWGRHADRTQERTWHFALPAFVASASFLTAALAPDPAVRFGGMALAVIGVSCAAPSFWAFPTRFLRASAAAGGIALINSVGNLAGYVGPSLMGVMKEATGTFGGGLIALAVSVAAAGVLALDWRLRRAAAPASS
jgi:ACS family tartrate transporter-like MFS transporter